jgi:hypothetical protein
VDLQRLDAFASRPSIKNTIRATIASKAELI